MLLTAISIITISKLNDKKEVVLDNVKLKNEIKNINGLAIMLEQDNGEFEESTNNTWPNDMYFNEELSGCIDNLGNKIENALTYENGIANLETSDTSYCVLYFNKTTNLYQLCKNYENINECETKENLENVKGIWNSTLEDDGYRYVGTNPDNYTCFGTIDQEECKKNTDKYMYRIIGIFEDGEGKQHLKLIKKEALNTTYAWNADYQNDVSWENSDLYKGINGIIGVFYNNLFIENASYDYMLKNNNWYNKIETWNYTATNTKTYENYKINGQAGIDYHYNTARTIYLHEMNRNSKSYQICFATDYANISSKIEVSCNSGVWENVGAKIGLLYVSDFLLSLGSTALEYASYDDYEILKTGWLHISNNDSEALAQYEWTLSRSGDNDGYYAAWQVYINGGIYVGIVNNDSYSIRPVFYLTSDVTISGDGTTTNPYIITN